MKHHENCPCLDCTAAHRAAGCQCERCALPYNPNTQTIPTIWPTYPPTLPTIWPTYPLTLPLPWPWPGYHVTLTQAAAGSTITYNEFPVGPVNNGTIQFANA